MCRSNTQKKQAKRLRSPLVTSKLLLFVLPIALSPSLAMYIKSMRRSSRYLLYGVCAFATVSEFHYRVGTVAVADGRSMEPAIADGSWVIISRNVSNTKRNDVVLLRSPTDPYEFLIKRVTKLEGEYTKKTFAHYVKPWIPRGHVWIEGDNKPMSLDSRDYGPVSKGLIQGKVICKFWPLSEAGFITAPKHKLVERLKAEMDTDPWADDREDDALEEK